MLDPSATVIYKLLTTFWPGRFDIEEASRQIGRECVSFTHDALTDYREVPSAARAYYAGVPPGSGVALFLGVPHVLHRGSLDINQRGIRIIEV